MSDVLTRAAPVSGLGGGPQAMAYLRDGDSEGVVRQALSDLGVSDAVFRTGGIAAAHADLNERVSPRLLVVDVSDLADPKAAVVDLIGRCQPSTGVVLVGASNDIPLYRSLREAGVVEYFFKPLVSTLVARVCKGVLGGVGAEYLDAPEARRGKLVVVIGARGGVGATTVAARAAWRLAEHPPRPVVLVDLDMQCGDAALQLEGAPNHALREALEQVDRVDDLFLERGIVKITNRLDLLASLEPLDDRIAFEEDALLSLLDILRRRYRYVVVEARLEHISALGRVLHLPSHLILVSDGGLASAREVRRIRQLLGPNTAERTLMHVLNKGGAPGALSLEEFTRGAGQAPDVIAPWSREIAVAAGMGVKVQPECPPFDRALAPVFARIAGERIEAGGARLSKWRLPWAG